jgi:hypothetical protein
MSLNKIRNGIVNRAAKVKDMRWKFEPEERVKQYQETSLRILKEDYLAEVKSMQESDRARLQGVEQRYRKSMPTQAERVQLLQLAQAEYKSLSANQLKRAVEDALKFPAALSDVTTLQALAGECRSRGDASGADTISGFVVGQSVATPWVHSEEYRSLEKRVAKLDVYTAQCQGDTMLILSDDPDHVAQSDCLTFESLDKEVPS